MIVFVCVDDENGMLFNRRRQSRDRAVVRDILQTCQEAQLWMDFYSAKLFAGEEGNFQATEDFLGLAGAGEYCFVENRELAPFAEKIERLIVYRWNRKYPGDFFLDLELSNWALLEKTEFPGNSHEKITKEIYAPGDGADVERKCKDHE